MRIRIERLRVWLLASAGLLVVVIAGFIGTARYLRRHFWGLVPQKLAADVEIDTSGITYSHTVGPYTDFVVHAARDSKLKDGKVELHDVWMKLCGRQQKRADMVRGDDWEYDQKAGVVRAMGVVHIELRAAAPNGKAGCTAADDAGDAAGAKTLRVTTSDLVYMNTLGVAATSAPIEFESGGLKGHAVGADYASDSGTLMLHSAVSLSGMQSGRPVEVNAASAEMDGQERAVRLTSARYATGAGDAARTAAADNAVLHLRGDQTLERIEAQGNVTLQAGGGTVSAAKADVAMNAAGHPVNAQLTGGVRYAATGPLAERRGEAQEAVIAFDGKASPQAQHAVFTGAAHFTEKARADAAKPAWNTRELNAAKLDVALAPDAAGKNEVRDAEATGGAKFSEVNVAGANGADTTEIAADDLKAHFVVTAAGSRPQLETMAGRGHTLVRQVNAAGVEQTSAGNALDARFRESGAGGKKAGVAGSRGAAAEITSTDRLAGAVQSGHVVVTRKGAKSAKGGAEPGAQEARAQMVSYDGDTDRATLDGGVQLTDVSGQLRASQVVIERATGNAQATGSVRAEYESAANGAQRSQVNAEPAHVLAERAELDHATDVVTFHGAPARMWQAGSQVEAPVIEMDRAAKRLIARGENATGWAGSAQVAQVRTVLMSAGGADRSAPAAGGAQACAAATAGVSAATAKAATAHAPQVIRVASGGLVYSQILAEADFTGGFRADTGDAAGGTIRAQQGAVYLKDTRGDGKTVGGAQGVPSMEGSVDRVVANGQVTVDRPGLHATGETLVYTTADRTAVLTGDAKDPPRAMDARGSTTTGAALELRRGCNGTGDTVEALGGVPGGPAGQVHTESRVDAAREKTAQ